MRSTKTCILLGALFLFTSISTTIHAQYVQTKRPSEVPANIVNNVVRGYIEALPSDYNAPENALVKYPLLLFFQGLSEAGTGSSSDLDKLISWDRQRPTAMIADGVFPSSFTVNGQTFKFIVISPQFNITFGQYPTPQEIDELITYMVNRYRVDPNRIYITGLSTGAGSIFYYAGSGSAYANRLAAVVPFSGTFGTVDPAQQTNESVRNRMRVIAGSNLPVWAFHNQGDPSVPTSISVNHINYINEPPAPNPPAKLTLFPAANPPQHDSWQPAYYCTSPSTCYTENGLNIYQWMLQYTRAANSTLPVKLKNLHASKSNNKIVINWETENEQDNSHFTLERSANGAQFQKIATITGANRSQLYSYTDQQPFAGINYYRLSQTDFNGRTVYFPVLTVKDNVKGKKISIAPNPVENYLNLQIDANVTGILRATIYSVNGMLIRDWKINKSSASFNESILVSGLPKGTYLLKVESKDFSEQVQFVK